ncbi:MAG: hypothetical protein K1X57_23075 [Gemmataceae bacterium]|nr:hypothetical protein [Gemmataceae bacterium]
MQIDPSSSTSSQYEAALNARVPKQTLGQEDFLKLITVQLAKQDPMKPMEDTAFIAQMAQFTSLEQTNQLAKEFAQLRAASELSSAGGLIGRQVTVLDSKKDAITGIVSGVDNSTGVPRLVIDGSLYSYSSITKVEPAPAPVPETTGSST